MNPNPEAYKSFARYKSGINAETRPTRLHSHQAVESAIDAAKDPHKTYGQVAQELKGTVHTWISLAIGKSKNSAK